MAGLAYDRQLETSVQGDRAAGGSKCDEWEAQQRQEEFLSSRTSIHDWLCQAQIYLNQCCGGIHRVYVARMVEIGDGVFIALVVGFWA